MSMACAGMATIPEITPQLTSSAEHLGFRTEELLRGRSTFARTCARCHALPDPRRIPAAGWDRVLQEMVVKARMPADEQLAVRAFVLACANADR